jgi:hypothetical protein
MKKTRLLLTAALILATFTPSCRLFRKSSKAAPAPVPAPAPAPPAPSAQPASPKPQQPEHLPLPPEVSPERPNLNQQPPEAPAEKLPPPPRRPVRPSHPREGTETSPPEAAPPPVPQLEQILTPEQRQAYNEDIDKNIGNALKTVAALQNRRLSREQKTYLARIRAFIEQANQARKTDLFRAKNLSERASVLADDLLKSVQ